MLNVRYILCLWAATVASVYCVGDMGEGRWSLLSVGACDEEGGEGEGAGGCALRVARRRHNRSLDVFDLALDCSHDLDDSYGAYITVCKHVDGGCKQWQVFADDSLPRLTKKYAEDNLLRLLAMAGLDPPDYPVRAGNYSVDEFYVNYCEFPKSSVYGTFEALSYLTRGGERTLCLKSVVQFDEDTEGYACA